MSRQLESLDLNLVNVLYHILVERSVTVAAERIGLSQPAVSRSLGRLRDVYGDPLVVKQGREMVPTPLGESLLPLASSAVEALRHVVNASADFDPATAQGTFRVAIKEAMGGPIVDIWERHVRPFAPDLELDLVRLTVDIAPDVVSGQIDMIVLTINRDVVLPPQADITELVMRKCCEDDFVTCLRRGHPLEGKPMTLERYLSLDHILINPLRGSRSVVDDWLEERGLERRIRYRAQDFNVAKDILQRTDCALNMPGSLIGEQATKIWATKSPVPVSPMEVSVGWHPNWTVNPRHKWIRDRLLQGLKEPLHLAA